jgi:glycine/D-amino acid oxidase-like deaminating enzyme
MNNNQHTTSYYAASAGQIPDYPALTGSHKADVCVIGAGFSGISTALHLAERGYKVHVVEANRVGWGASGRNGGQLIGGISGEGKMANKAGPGGERLLWELRWAGHDIIRERVNTYDIDCDLKWGYLDVAFKPRHLRDQLEERENLERYQFPHEYRLLSKEETQEIIGTEAYIGALLNMGNGHLHPLKLCLGEARAAQSLGVEIWEQSPVVRIDRGSPATVVTAQGSVSADPLSDEQVQACNPKDLAVCDPNFILQYYRLSADKRLLFGGRCNYFGEDPEHIKAMMRPKMERIYPRLKGIKIDYAWGGTIGVTANRVPQLGKLANNIYFSQGYSGHGVNVTHLAGRTMAEAVAGTSETLDVFSAVKPFTVPGIRRWQKTLVSLGMLYYSIKDRL